MYKLPGFSRIKTAKKKKGTQNASGLPVVQGIASVTTVSRQTKVSFAMMDYDLMSSTDSSTDFEDVLERKIEDLSRQLTEERQLARKEKQQVARLQREITRHRGDRDRTGKDTLMKDLEKERLARANAEQRLREMTVESNNCRTRLMALQDEFKRMEEVVKNMMQYKTKIEQLKQEKSSLSITYENNILKYRSHISTLERENIMLMNDVRKFESQQMNGKADDRSKHLLERLKVLETENATLVYENEQQRQQYEKCLDEIANQVVQALLAQKALREECLKLQTKVQDLEYQNHELNTIFQHKYSSDTVLQISQSQSGSTSTLCDANSLTAHSSVSSLPTQTQFSSAIALTQTMHLSPMSQYVLQTMVAQKCLGANFDAGRNSFESLQSICSDYTCDESIGKPQMSSPLVWPEDKAGKPIKSIAMTTPNVPSSVDRAKEYNRRTKIETEFPATNSSPKIKHVSVLERANQGGDKSLSTSSLQTVPKERQAKTNSTSSLNKSNMSLPPSGAGSELPGHRGMLVQEEKDVSQRSSSHPDHIHKASVITPDHPVLKPRRGSAGKITVPRERSSSSSSLREKALMRERSSSASSAIPVKQGSRSQKTNPQSLSKMAGKSRQDSSRESICSSSSSIHSAKSDSKTPVPVYAKVGQGHKVAGSDRSVKDKMTALKESLGNPPRVPLLPSAQYFYDYSDEDSDFNRPTSCNLSNTSTISLNEILDDDDDTDTLLDEEFCAEKFAFFDSPSFVKKCEEQSKKGIILKNLERKNKDVSGLHGKPDIVKDTEYSELKNQVKSPHVSRKRNSLQHHRTKRVQGIPRPSSLILAPREKQFIYQGYSSSSSSLESSDSDENWSPKFARKQYNMKQSRVIAKCRVSPHSLPSPSSDIIPRKNSHEEMNIPKKLSPVDTPCPVSPDHVMTSSTESNSGTSNSLSRKKGPPPPVPKKPITGRRSPGIKMGLQSPGFRHNKKDGAEMKSVNISLKSPDIRTENCNQSKPEEYQESQVEVKDTSKYVPADLTFDSVKVDKVERSGSKDDGYSTMSSDIQPEAMEKFSDASLQKKESVIIKETSIKVEEQQPTVVNGVKVSKSGAELASDPDSAMDSSTHSTEMRNSNHSLSSQNSNSSEDRAAAYGSLGRVKAMKMLFEAESQKQTDHKIVKFPLRKSPSVDSKLGGNRETHPSRNVNRRSLGDDTHMFSSEINRNLKEDFSKLLLRTSRDEPAVCDEISCFDMSTCDMGNSAPPLLPEPSLSVSAPAVFQHVQMLNISEENFLSDIPEEKDEWDASTNSCEKILEDSLKNLQSSSKYHAHLQLLQSFTVKQHWSSMQGLARVMSNSDLTSESNDKGLYHMDDYFNFDVSISKPMDRSMSLSDLHCNHLSESRHRVKVVPKLVKVTQVKKEVCEISEIQRVQTTLKNQILKQLAHRVESESDDDEMNGFQPLISQSHLHCKGQGHTASPKQVTAAPSFISHPPPALSHSSGHQSNPPHHGNQTTSQDNVNETVAPDGEDGLHDQGRQFSSKESSPCPEGQQQKTGKFRSDYYSLCTVGSNKSLFSGSNEGENDPVLLPPRVHTCQTEEGECAGCDGAKNSNEFDEISRQLENLSKTVNALHRSLTSLNSCDTDNESNEDHTPLCQPQGGNFGDTEGYQWVEDEFYLTPCGGEIILGSSPFSETGACCDWVNEYADDTSCNDEFEFYGSFSSAQHTGMADMRPAYSPIKEEEKDFGIVDPPGAGEVCAPGISDKCDTDRGSIASRRSRQSSSERDSEDAEILDPKARAAMLDSMVHLSGASMDSLDDNIGVDHVMCSRLLGRGEKMNVMRSAAHSRPTIDLSKFFLRFGDQEKEAVAAFDFLNDISTSPENTAVDQSTHPSQSNTSALDQSTHPSHIETSASNQSAHPSHTSSQPLTTRTQSSQSCVKQPQGLASEPHQKKTGQERMQTTLGAETHRPRTPQMSSIGHSTTRQGVPKTSSIPKVPQTSHYRQGMTHSPVPRLGIQGATSHAKTDTHMTALKQAMGFAEGNPPTNMKEDQGLASSLTNGKPGHGLIGSKLVASNPKDNVPNKKGIPTAAELKTQDKTQNGACAVPASPKPSRIGFFRRKSSDKKGGNEEKPSKLPKKTSQGAKDKEKDKSKIPKAVKQEQNSSKSGRKFLQRSSSSSSSKSSSSGAPGKGGHS